MEKEYSTVAPVLQNAANFCWAACMEWWLTYMPNRAIIQQADFFTIPYIADMISESDGENAGGLTRKGIQRLMEYPDFKMTMETKHIGELNITDIRSLLNKSPIVIAFTNPNGGNHFNVIVKAWTNNWGGGSVVVMEPATGQFVNRFVDHFKFARQGCYLGYGT